MSSPSLREPGYDGSTRDPALVGEEPSRCPPPKGDPDIIDQTLILDGEPSSVIGVMPEGFESRTTVDIWLPAQAGAGYATDRGNNNYFLVARLRNGVSLAQAQSQTDPLTALRAE